MADSSGMEDLQRELDTSVLPLTVSQIIRRHIDDLPSRVGSIEWNGRVFLRSISVRGFRGVGATATVKLDAGPGLTLVTGRNGCGKSSFAEAVERVLTGTTLRWKRGSPDGQENWRNIHQPGECGIRVVWRAEHDTSDFATKLDWAAHQGFLDGDGSLTRSGQPARSWSANEWSSLVSLTPPLLSYAALGSVVSGKPSELFDEFNHLVGLGDVEDLVSRLVGETKTLEDAVGTAQRDRQTVVGLCRASDDRVVTDIALHVERGSISPEATLDRLKEVATGSECSSAIRVADWTVTSTDAAARVIEELAAAQSQRANLTTSGQREGLILADMLDHALDLVDGESKAVCPVCGIGTLDASWRQATLERVEGLRRVAQDLADVSELRRKLVDRFARMFPAVTELSGSDTDERVRELHHAIEVIVAELDRDECDISVLRISSSTAIACMAVLVAEALEARSEATVRLAPIVAAAHAWSASAEQAESAQAALSDHRKAVRWAKDALKRLRSERLEAISDNVLHTWSRVGRSHGVALLSPEIKGERTHRKLELRCVLDGVQAQARSVLSQGELHALGLSLFLARSTRPSSRFGFVLIDDPVQAFDRQKVDGLAGVLGELAGSRQVVVFTHDDRLAEAVDRLGIDANHVTITRAHESVVTVTKVDAAVSRALDEADALARDEHIEPSVAERAVGGACRTALDRAAVVEYRRRSLAQGRTIDDVDALITKHTSLWDRVGLALFDTSKGTADQLRARGSHADRRLIEQLNRAGHESTGSDARDLVRETRQTIKRLFAEVAE